MGAIVHSRLYNVIVRRLGLKTVHGLEFDEKVIPVALVDDLTDLTKPLLGATFGGQAPRAPVVALRGAAELFTGPASGWLHWWDDNASNFNAFSIGRASLITANIATFSATLAAGDPDQSAAGARFRLQSGTIPGAATGVRMRSNVVFQMPIYLPPGTFVTIQDLTANDDQNVGMIWVELPDL